MVLGETGTSQKRGWGGILGRAGGAVGRQAREGTLVASWYLLFSCLVSLSLLLVHRRAFFMQLPLAMLLVVIPGFGDLDLAK